MVLEWCFTARTLGKNIFSETENVGDVTLGMGLKNSKHMDLYYSFS